MGTWETGQMNTDTRCFDLLCFGKCDLNSTNIKLNVNSANRIPNFFTKNADGKIIVAQLQPMMTITTPKGHNTWVQIELKTINEKNISELSQLEKHVCLGIKKRSENDYFCILNADNLSEYVDLFDWDALELVPLLSNTEGVIAPGDEIDPANFGLANADSFDFGSVYRISVKTKGAWLRRAVNLKSIDNASWVNMGRICAGIIIDQDSEVLGGQLLIMSDNGQLAYSSEGIHWNKYGLTTEGNNAAADWIIAPAYGNGIWATIGREHGGAWAVKSRNILRSIDGGKIWLDTGVNIRSHNLSFGNGVFLTVASMVVYTSSNAKVWNAVGYVPQNDIRCVVYGDNKWICVSIDGHVYCSQNGEGEWTLLSEELYNMKLSSESTDYCWEGGFYVSKHFYVIQGKQGTIVRSVDGVKWENVIQLGDAYRNLTYYRNRLYTINEAGTYSYIGLPNL